MSTMVSIYLHHHGSFTPETFKGKANYAGGSVKIFDVDTDVISFLDLEDFAKACNYNKYDYLYFQTDGHTFSKGLKLLYDDDSFRSMISLCLPFKRINLFVDHNKTFQTTDLPPTSYNFLDNLGREDEVGGSVVDRPYSVEGDLGSDDSEDPDYGGEEFVSDDEYDSDYASDEELVAARKLRKEHDYDSEESEYNSDELRSEDSSSEDENIKQGYIGIPPGQKRKKKQRIIDADKDEVVKWNVGMKFSSMAEFRKIVRDYGIRERRAVHFIKNDQQRCQVGCESGCSFYLWCSKLPNEEAVQVKTCLDDHQCTKPYHNSIISVKYLTELYGDRIRQNPQWKVKDMIQVIRDDLEVEVPRIKCSRVRKAALEGVYDTLKEHYARVWDFGYEILKHNPNNRVEIMTSRVTDESENKFKRIYICYHALKTGWKTGCRPVLGLDGCFLKTVCGGQLLSAVSRDGNNQMFPIAFGVVESENTDSWRWFIELLKDDLELGNGFGITVISDQQKGLENAMKEHMPRVEHRLCTRHLYANLRKRFPSGALRKAFWAAACATYPAAHQKAMKAIQRMNKTAYDQLQRLDPKSWTKSCFQTHAFADNVENNMSECFNAWIINARYMPLLTMIQEIHFKLMSRIKSKREEMLAIDYHICPRVKKKLDLAVKFSRRWSATWDGDRKYMVRQGTRSITVDLDARSCDCRAWDLTGIPCEHAVAAIHDRRHQPSAYVSHFYSKEMYLKTYGVSLQALRGEDFWEISDKAIMLPLEMPKKLRGRPKRLRRREDWEGGSQNRSQAQPQAQVPGLKKLSGGRKMHCGFCGKPGHKRTTCTEIPGQASNEHQSKASNECQHEDNNQTQEEGVNQTQEEGANQGQKEGANQGQKEGSRAKLPMRRKVMPSIVIKEPTIAKSYNFKAPRQNPTPRQESPFWMQKKDKEVVKKQARSNFVSFAEHKMKEGRTVDAPLKPCDPFEARLVGPLGLGTMFMPTPGFILRNHQPNAPDVATDQDGEESLEDYEDQGEDIDNEGQDGGARLRRRSKRVINQKCFKFSNTPECPVDLDED